MDKEILENKKSTREKILEASIRLFAENSFSATSVRKISNEAGFRESVIYNHFNSKDDLLKTIVIEELKFTRKEFLHSIDTERIKNHPKSILESISSEVLNCTQDNNRTKLMKIIIMEMFRDEKANQLVANTIIGRGKKILIGLFTKMMEEGVIKEKNPELLAVEFSSTLFYFSLEYLLFNSFNKEDFDGVLLSEYIDSFWESIKVD